jgi:hypothetical protein
MTLPSKASARIGDSILDTIGDTPLVRLSRIGAGLRPQLMAKLEVFNPGGSIKDRVAVALIEAATAGCARAARSWSPPPATPAPVWPSPRG